MKLTKLTEQYTLREQSGIYIIDFGTIKQKVPVKVTIRFEEISVNNFLLKVTCGCTKTDKKVISPTIVEQDIIYNAAALGKIDKTLIITDGNKRTELKLTGATI